MGKVILMMLLAVVSSSVMAAEGPYRVYTCPTESDAQACSKSCKKMEATIGFKVNQSNGVILQTVFRDGAVIRSSGFENCQIVDADNWFCDESSYSSLPWHRSKKSLVSGVFSYISVFYNSKGKESSESYMCAKKKGWGIFD